MAAPRHGIQLHADFEVAAVREAAFLAAFDGFVRVARNAPGFIDARLLKLRAEKKGRPAAGRLAAPAFRAPRVPWRLVQWWESEESRSRWCRSPDYRTAWAPLEKSVVPHADSVTALLFDIRG